MPLSLSTALLLLQRLPAISRIKHSASPRTIIISPRVYSLPLHVNSCAIAANIVNAQLHRQLLLLSLSFSLAVRVNPFARSRDSSREEVSPSFHESFPPQFSTRRDRRWKGLSRRVSEREEISVRINRRMINCEKRAR